MSPEASTEAVAAAIGPYRERLADDARDFTLALLALAKANAAGSAGFNAPSPQDAVALHALSRWRRDAQSALRRVRATSDDAPTRDLAVRWLRALIAAVDFQRQGLSLADPAKAAEAARSARKKSGEASNLRSRLERKLA